MRTLFIALVLAAALGGCGGENSPTPNTTPDSGAANPPATAGGTVSALTINPDASVPEAGVKQVTSVTTPFAQGKFGESIPTGSPDASTEVLVMALDSSNRIMLASMEPAGQTGSLSAASTAVALARIAFGDLGEQLAGNDLNQAIRDAKSFGELTQLVNAALAAGVSPAGDTAVLSKLNILQEEAATILSARVNAGSVKTTLAVVEPSVDHPLPYSILGHSGKVPTVSIVAAGEKSISIANSQPIAWSISTTSGDVAQLSPASAMSYIGQNLPVLSDFFKPTSIKNAGGRVFQVQASFDTNAKIQTIGDMARSVIGLAVKGLTPGGGLTCSEALLSAVNASNKIPAFATGAAFSNVWTFVKTLFDGAGGVVKSCNIDLKDFTPLLGSRLTAIGGFLAKFSPFKGISSALTVGGLVYQSTYAATYWSEGPFSVTVCQAMGTFEITNCAVRFEATPPILPLLAGANTTPTYLAFDKNGNRTLLPGNLVFSTDKPGQADVNPVTGKIDARAPSTATITMTDDSNPLSKAVVTAIVFDPPILSLAGTPSDQLANPVLSVGESRAIRFVVGLTDADIITTGASFSLTSDNTAVLDVNGTTATAKAGGKANILFTNNVTGTTASLPVNVKCGVQGSSASVDLCGPSPGGFSNVELACKRRPDGSATVTAIYSAELQPGEQITAVAWSAEYFTGFANPGTCSSPTYKFPDNRQFGLPGEYLGSDCVPTDGLTLHPVYYATCHNPLTGKPRNIWVTMNSTVSSQLSAGGSVVVQFCRITTPNLNNPMPASFRPEVALASTIACN